MSVSFGMRVERKGPSLEAQHWQQYHPRNATLHRGPFVCEIAIWQIALMPAHARKNTRTRNAHAHVHTHAQKYAHTRARTYEHAQEHEKAITRLKQCQVLVRFDVDKHLCANLLASRF